MPQSGATTERRRGRPARLAWALALGASYLLLGVVGSTLLVRHLRGPGTNQVTGATVPRYRNLDASAAYVGDAACAECHLDKADTYREHPMGRSFAPIASLAAEPPPARNSFDKFGSHFVVETRGGEVLHKEQRLDARGQLLAEAVSEVQYVLGSGQRGRSFLVNRNGFLFQSPISWYSQKQTWDVSPGLIESNHAERAITPLCVFCHCNDAQPIEGMTNRYRQPLFHAYAIGCERCHGPGSLHVHEHENSEATVEPDDTIVNPGRLPPVLREAVCQQCHLQGEERILRRGRQPFDYRPGLPVADYWSVFVKPGESVDDAKAVGHFEQMSQSRCYQASQGRLGCISCHDPHELPSALERVAYYRDRCQFCHAERGCSLPQERRQSANANDCIACHMPRFDSSDIAHTAVSDHRVIRQARKSPASSEAVETEVPLVYYFKDQISPDDKDAARDLGVALMEQAWHHADRRRGQAMAARALPLLDEAVRSWPDDVPAREARGSALDMLGRRQEALAIFEGILVEHPGQERSRVAAALLATALGKPNAFAYWERAIALDPWPVHSHGQLARLLAERGEWDRAIKECEAVLRLNPGATETRLFLGLCLLRSGARDRAKREFHKALAMNPPDRDAAERWIREQLK